MSKKEQEIYQQYHALNRQGWNIPNTNPVLAKNHGESETLHHRIAKTIAASVATDSGYRTHSEVETDSGDECDVLAYGHPERRPIVIELERDLSEEVRDRKVSQYLTGDVREVWVIDLDSAPSDYEALYEYIAEQTGLQQ